MRIYKILTSVAFFAASVTAVAQNATVEKYSVVVNCENDKAMSVKKHLEVMIHNKQGEDMADFAVHLEHGSVSLGDFSGVVTDANGRVVRKIKKGDVNFSDYSTEFKTDGYGGYYSFTPSAFPVKVTYEWTLNYSKKVVGFDALDPLPDYDVDVKEASYELTVPADMEVLYSKRNTDAEVMCTEAGGKRTYRVRMTDLPAVKSEPLAPPFYDLEPAVVFVPKYFNLYGRKGSFESWEDFGLWEWQLCDGRQAIPADLAAKIDAKIDRTADKHAQIKQVCNMMRQMTRYISIQVGIGGWQPEMAEVTARLGLGDCKALTCLLRGMLEHVGIASYPVLLNTHREKFATEFATMGQTNHMILCVPTEKDTLWVECTNLTMPVGFRHDGMAGHEVVVCTPEGGKMVTIPGYRPEENLWESDIRIDVKTDGKADIDIRQKSYNEQYENMLRLTHLEVAEQKKSITANYKLGNIMEYRKFAVSEVEDSALIVTEVGTTSSGYASMAGSRMMIPVNPMHKNYSQLKNVPSRQLPVVTTFGYEDKEHIVVAIPEGYVLETLPKEVHLNTAVGSIDTYVKASAKEVTIDYDVKRCAGQLPADSYGEVQNLVKQIYNAYNQRIVIKKGQ